MLIPIFVVALLSPWPEWLPYPEFWAAWQPWIAAIVFAAISATDAVDGHLARSRNEVTDLGKFMDPLADKILVCAAMLALVELAGVSLVGRAHHHRARVHRLRPAHGCRRPGQGHCGELLRQGEDRLAEFLAILLFIVKDTLQVELLGGGIATGFTIFSWVVLAAAVAMTLVSLLDYFNKTKDLLGFTSKKEA